MIIEANNPSDQIKILKKQLKTVKTSDRIQAAKLRAQLEKNKELESELAELRSKEANSGQSDSHLQRELEKKKRQNELILQQLSDLEELYLAAIQENDELLEEMATLEKKMESLFAENEKLAAKLGTKKLPPFLETKT